MLLWVERAKQARCGGCVEPQPLSDSDAAEDAGLTVAGWTEDPPPFSGESPRRDRCAGTPPPPEGAAAVGDQPHPIAA